MNKNIRVEYFAMLRERAGVESETVQTLAANAVELFDELNRRHGFQLSTKNLRVAVNDQMASWQNALATGDTVVFIPPTAGG